MPPASPQAQPQSSCVAAAASLAPSLPGSTPDLKDLGPLPGPCALCIILFLAPACWADNVHTFIPCNQDFRRLQVHTQKRMIRNFPHAAVSSAQRYESCRATYFIDYESVSSRD